MDVSEKNEQAYVSCRWRWMRDEWQPLEPAGDAVTQYRPLAVRRRPRRPRPPRASPPRRRTTGWRCDATPDRRTVRRRRGPVRPDPGEVRRPSGCRHWGCAGHGWSTTPGESTPQLDVLHICFVAGRSLYYNFPRSFPLFTTILT